MPRSKDMQFLFVSLMIFLLRCKTLLKFSLCITTTVEITARCIYVESSARVEVLLLFLPNRLSRIGRSSLLSPKSSLKGLPSIEKFEDYADQFIIIQAPGSKTLTKNLISLHFLLIDRNFPIHFL